MSAITSDHHPIPPPASVSDSIEERRSRRDRLRSITNDQLTTRARNLGKASGSVSGEASVGMGRISSSDSSGSSIRHKTGGAAVPIVRGGGTYRTGSNASEPEVEFCTSAHSHTSSGSAGSSSASAAGSVAASPVVTTATALSFALAGAAVAPVSAAGAKGASPASSSNSSAAVSADSFSTTAPGSSSATTATSASVDSYSGNSSKDGNDVRLVDHNSVQPQAPLVGIPEAGRQSWQAHKSRSHSAEGVLLAVQSRHREALAAGAATLQKNSSSSGGDPSAVSSEQQDEDEAPFAIQSQAHNSEAQDAMGTIGRHPGFAARRRVSDGYGVYDEMPISAPARTSSSSDHTFRLPTTSPPMQAASRSAGAGVAIAFPSGSASPPPQQQPLLHSHSTKRSKTFGAGTEHQQKLARKVSSANQQQKGAPQVRARIESLRDLVGSQGDLHRAATAHASSMSRASSVRNDLVSMRQPPSPPLLQQQQQPSSQSQQEPQRRPRMSWQHSLQMVFGGGGSSSANGTAATEAASGDAGRTDEAPRRRSADLLSNSRPLSPGLDAKGGGGTGGRPRTAGGTLANNSTSSSAGGPSGGGGALEAKLVILGSQGVGKTSIVHRYTSGQFNASAMPSTIGASFLTKRLIVSGTRVRLQIWDTAGQERFRSMAPMYYRGSHAAIVVYDITNRKSLDDLRSWIEELRKNMGDEMTIHVVGAKKDLTAARQVSLQDARNAIREWYREHAAAAAENGAGGRAAPRVKVTPPTRTSSTISHFTNSITVSRFQSSLRSPLQAPGSPESDEAGAHDPSSSAAGGSASDEAMACEREFWNNIQLSEVSAKDDPASIEEIFYRITKRLVERKASIESERAAAARDSILLTPDSFDPSGQGTIANKAGWSCCNA